MRAANDRQGTRMEQTVTKSRLRPRRIIERPRLTRILDASKAQIRMLIAPAGYGKTTLAEQWTSAGGRRAAWYPCRSSSADVAVLSIGLAQAGSELLPGCDRRLRERVRATRNPPGEVDVLAEILAEDLADWPADAWLVIDDYHFVCRIPEAERFVEILVERSPVNLLIASRQRPAWVSSRLLLYEKVFELNQAQLAMDRDEADGVLCEERAQHAAGLIALANGWPAVIGLAGVTRSDLVPGATAPVELYEFFAEEVYRGLHADVQVDLGVLVIAPTLDRELVLELLGASRAARSLAESLAIGILEARGRRLDFHPLARTFVETRTHPDALAQRQSAIGTCLRVYRQRRDWDSAFELIERSGQRAELDAMIPEALDSLLESGRLATIEAWVAYAASEGEMSPIVKLAAAELGARRGKLVVAETMIHGALRQVESGTDLQARALNVAGQVAHLASREADGLEFFSRAEAAAHDEASRREARWGRLMTMTALEQDEARELLTELARDVRPDDPRERLRLEGKRVSLALRFGDLPTLEGARQAEQLLDLVGDPSIRCSFRSVYSSALVLGAYYEDALRVAQDLVHDAATSRVDFGLTYGYAVSALALAGHHRFNEAHSALGHALSAARRCTDAVGEQNVYAIRVRILLQEGRIAEACAVEPPDVSDALPAIRGEVKASRGLALACAGRADDAMGLAAEALQSTQSLEVAVLSAAIRAVVEVRARWESAFDAAENLLETALQRGGLDLFVTCYRASPDILGMLLSSSRTSERVVFALARGGDQELARVLGTPADSVFDPLSTLSKREREVYALLCEGMSDREIGRLLFIAPGTAKRHALRILSKTGFKSRRALMLGAARRRLDQAAPTATRDEDSATL